MDAAAATLDEIDVVGAGAGGDDEAERGEEAEDSGGEGEGGAAEHGGDRRRWSGELVEWKEACGGG